MICYVISATTGSGTLEMKTQKNLLKVWWRHSVQGSSIIFGSSVRCNQSGSLHSVLFPFCFANLSTTNEPVTPFSFHFVSHSVSTVAKTELKRNEKSHFFSSFLVPAVRTEMDWNKKRSGKWSETNEPVAPFCFLFVSHSVSNIFMKRNEEETELDLMNLSLESSACSLVPD